MATCTVALTLIAAGSFALFEVPRALAADVSAAPASTWATNGSVDAIVTTATTTYIGGVFSLVGRGTGPGVGVDTGTAQDGGLARVSGGGAKVTAAAADGSGGFYIGGDFTHVGGAARSNIAHILADGGVDPDFAPNANGTVDALAVSGSTVYAGGWFSTIGGQARSGIAALDAATGAATSWNPSATGASLVLALAVSGSTVYVGGRFSGIGGQPRADIAALDIASGNATNWNPGADHDVQALAVSGSTVYAGGAFTSIGGEYRNYIAAIDPAGTATGWDPDSNYYVDALAVSGSTVYAGGWFGTIGGKDRSCIAALDTGSGAATSWNPNATCQEVDALTVSGSTVYAGGLFSAMGGQSRTDVAALDSTDGTATAWNLDPTSTKADNTGAVTALAVSGSTVYVGGSFGMIGGRPRGNIAALDNATGEPTDWNPDATGGGVAALVLSGSTLYAGGAFTSIGGQPRSGIAALDAATGLATGWNPGATGGGVAALVVSGSTLYAGGNFSSIGGQARRAVAALDVATGKATSFEVGATTGESVHALALSGATLYLGGGFSSLGGLARKGIAAVDATTGALKTWDPNAGCTALSSCNLVDAIVVSGSTIFVGGEFIVMGGQPRAHLAALSASTGAATPWNPDADDAVFALALSGSTLFVGGWFTFLGGAARNQIAAVDAASGALTGWNPKAYGWNQRVLKLAVGADNTLYAGGSFSGFDAAPQAGFAAFPSDQRTLTVARTGTGSGTVTAVDGHINCGATCRYDYALGASVTLTATAAANSTFRGWSGAGCSGTGACTVTMSSSQKVTATFAMRAPAPVTLPAITGTAALGKVLSCSNGTWKWSPTRYTRQWYRNGASISGATATTHAVVSADLQRKLTCTVTATNAGGSTRATSAPVTVKATTVLTEWETLSNGSARSCGSSTANACPDRKGATVYFKGSATPVPIPAATRAVTVRFYHLASGTWHLQATVTVKTALAGGTWNLVKTGATALTGAWRVYASVAGTTTLTSAVSPYRYYRVT